MAAAGSKRPHDVFDLGQLRELIELMKEHELNEVELREDGKRIRVTRGALLTSAVAHGSSPGGLAAVSSGTEEIGTAATAHSHVVTINSPMVGTFYAQATPDSPPFAKVGDHVGPDTVVCIIEAMKVFNEIPAEVSGQIVAVLVENEESVEFGKPLFKVDTSK